MSPSNALFTIMISAATLLGASNVSAATTTTAAQCEQMLSDLGPKQDMLSELEKAVAEGRARQDALLIEANDIGFDIANERSDGATESDVQSLVAERDALFAQVDAIETTLRPIEHEIDALTTEVDSASRGYIACIESTLG